MEPLNNFLIYYNVVISSILVKVTILNGHNGGRTLQNGPRILTIFAKGQPQIISCKQYLSNPKHQRDSNLVE